MRAKDMINAADTTVYIWDIQILAFLSQQCNAVLCNWCY